MKKIFLVLAIALSLFAEVKTLNVTPALVNSHIKIIDIRTNSEWIQTGIVKNSIPITFFDSQGGYDVDKFMNQLSKHVNKNEEFALICRTGNRTTAVSDYLGKIGYKVINLKGGIKSLMQQGYKLEKYKN